MRGRCVEDDGLGAADAVAVYGEIERGVEKGGEKGRKVSSAFDFRAVRGW